MLIAKNIRPFEDWLNLFKISLGNVPLKRSVIKYYLLSRFTKSF
jgi:hypothetical protein